MKGNVMKPLIKLFKNFWGNTGQYFKINSVALLLIALVITITLVLFLPKQKHVDQELNKRYNSISELYNSKTGQWTDKPLAMKLQNEATAIENDSYPLKLLKFTLLFGYMIVLIPIGAWVLQWLYTDVKFTRQIYTGADMKYSDDERRSKMIVLAAALLCSAMAIGVSAVIAFFG